ncbi:MAG: cell division topological specificity factor MinE [Pseudomonadota bacterium]
MKQLLTNTISRVGRLIRRTPKSAKFAKERLQIIISHERNHRDKPDYFAAMQQDLLDVIAKYVSINKDDVRVELDRKDGCSVLELNVILPGMR